MKQGPSLTSVFSMREKKNNYAHAHAQLAHGTSKVPNVQRSNSVLQSLPAFGKNTPLLAESFDKSI